jgi:hypothetical protein
MTLEEVAKWIANSFKYTDGTIDEEFESIISHLKADPDFKLREKLEDWRKHLHDYLDLGPPYDINRNASLLIIKKLNEILGKNK